MIIKYEFLPGNHEQRQLLEQILLPKAIIHRLFK